MIPHTLTFGRQVVLLNVLAQVPERSILTNKRISPNLSDHFAEYRHQLTILPVIQALGAQVDT